MAHAAEPGGGRGGGQLPGPHLQTRGRGKRYQMPPPQFADLVKWCLQARKMWKCVKYYQKCVKFACIYFKILQLLGDFVPRPPTRAPPLDPAGGLPSPRPRGFAPIPNLLPPPLMMALNSWDRSSDCWLRWLISPISMLTAQSWFTISVRLSVCLSVCLAVTLWYYIWTNAHVVELFDSLVGVWASF